MKHFGDITKIHGWDIEQVDVVCGGSPCQDLSQAGKRKGLAGERSGLFMEQIRILKEMKADADARMAAGEFIRHPIRWGIWENVPGAFSSNNGEDFRCVLEEFCKIIDPTVSIPGPANGKWAHAGLILLNGGSVAWRLHDAQFWGKATPQRRKRVSVVADFRGECAGEVLFERKGSGRDFAESGAPGQNPAPYTQGSIGTAGCGALSFQERAGKPGGGKGILIQQEKVGTLSTLNNQAVCYEQPLLLEMTSTNNHVIENGVCPTLTARMGTGGNQVNAVLQPIPYGICSYNSNSMMSDNPNSGIYEADISRTLDRTTCGAPVCNQGGMAVVEKVYGIDRAAFNQGENAQFDFKVEEELSAPLLAVGPNAVGICETYCMQTGQANAEINRELCGTLNCNHEKPIITTTETAYGFYPQMKAEGMSFTEEKSPTIVIGTNPGFQNGVCTQSIVRRLTPLECERMQGFPDGWTHIGDWVDSKGKLHKGDSDSPRYRALGNSICTSFWKVLAKRISAQYDHDITMGSLFDGIGGFPYVFEAVNGKGTARWASEIEEFPIAVTKVRFPE